MKAQLKKAHERLMLNLLEVSSATLPKIEVCSFGHYLLARSNLDIQLTVYFKTSVADERFRAFMYSLT